MLLNYCKMAWRNLLKDRQYTLLNLIGLGTGLACTLLIWLWVRDEQQVDKYNTKDARLYQVMQNLQGDHGIETIENTAGLLANALAAEMPEVEKATTVLPASWFGSSGTVLVGEASFKADGQFISSTYFDVFTCPIVSGSAARLFADRHTVGISEALAAKLFKGQDAIGKTLQWKQNEFDDQYVVAAVFKKNPANALEQFDLLIDFAVFVDKREGMLSWGNSDPHTYVLLHGGTNTNLFNNKLENFLATKDKGTKSTLFARRFSDKYLYGSYTEGKQTGGRILYVRLFMVVALFILLIACVNFMNLSTAKAARRIKEVGIQKTLGATRASLALQHLSESLIMTFVSLLFGLLLVALLLPAFNSLTGKSLYLQLSGQMIWVIGLVTVCTGLLAGGYPALYISGFKPAAVLKGNVKTSLAELWVRKGLVVFQFSLSIFGIASVMIIQRQVNYIQQQNLGYNRENLVHFQIPLGGDSVSFVSGASFMNELKNIPGVINVSSYYHNLMGNHGQIGDFQWPGKTAGNNIDFVNLEVGANFMETMNIHMKEGRYFTQGSNNFFQAVPEIIFNESAIAAMGLKDPIGKKVKFWDQERTIVGVAADFHFESLYHTVRPCFFQCYPVMPNVLVKINAGADQKTIGQVKETFTRFYGSLPFDYAFLQEEVQAMYQSENRVATISRYFSGLAILISCLGLFGLAAFTAKRRQKEIGIRKVLGSSVGSVVLLLSRGYLQLVALAALIALPLVTWLMSDWLNGFAYHTKIDFGIMAITLVLTLLLTLFTIGYQSLRAAIVNPVQSLRNKE